MAARPHTVDGNALEVKRAVPKADAKKPEAPANANVKKIFVGGLKNDIEEDHLSNYFSQFGQVEKSEIMSDMETGKKRGFGFVHFTDHGSADKAVVEKFHTIKGHRVEVKKAVAKQEMQAGNRTGATPSFVTYSKPQEAYAAMAARPHTVDGNALEVKRAVPKADAKKPEAPANANVKKIFVGGLKNDIEDDHLSDYFSQFGQVEKSEIMSDMETGKKRGFGFVHFTDHGSADKAVVEKFHTIKGHRVEVKKAVAKQEMQAGNRTGTTPRVMPSQDMKANQNGYSVRDHSGNNGYENGEYQGYNGPFDQGSCYNRNYGYGNGGGYGGYGGYSSSYRCFNCGQENGYNTFGSEYGQHFSGYGSKNGPFDWQRITAPYNRGYGGY